jgi:quercetin dioxygenase-like cupin family protein
MAGSAAMTQSMLIRRDGGRVTVAGPFGVVEKVPSHRTNGVISIVEHPVAPGILVPPHVHADVDEWSYVLEGEVGARIGDEEFTAPQGSYVLKPRGILHTFWNAGPAPARLIEIITPGGFERFFETLGELVARGERTPERLAQEAAKYGMSYDMSWVPELEERYGVRVLG